MRKSKPRSERYASEASRAHDRAQDKKRRAERWRRWRAAGACGYCGLPVEKFAACNACRAIQAKKSLRYWRRKRALLKAAQHGQNERKAA
jgi:hypothetical protein